MKFKKLGKSLLMLGLTACMSFGMFACGENGDDANNGGGGGGVTNVDQTPTKLGQVNVVVNGATATWTAVENASGYEYSFDNGKTFTFTTETSVAVEAGKTIIVRAAGDGVNYRHGNWSNVQSGGNQGDNEGGNQGGGTQQATKLATPQVTLNGNMASWTEVENAAGYVISVGDVETQLPSSVTTTTLENGQTLKVKAKGDGSTYTDSEWSNMILYTESTQEPEEDQLATPDVERNENVVSWGTVEHASGYVYVINDGAEQTTDKTEVEIQVGDTFKVKAKGDGTTYTDSAWSTVINYTVQLAVPQVTLNGNVASWTAVGNATEYKYKYTEVMSTVDTTDKTSITLRDGQSLWVCATSSVKGYTDSDWSQVVTFNKTTLGKPTISINGNEVSWLSVSSATGYVVSVDGTTTTVDANTTSYTLNASASEVKVKAINSDTTLYNDSDWSNSVSYTKPANALATPTITVSGKTVSWGAITGASGYIVNINGTDLPMQTGTTYTLTGAATIKVKAKGDGTNYADSAYSVAKTYTELLVNSCDAYNQTSQIQYWVASNGATSLESTIKTQGVNSIKLVANAWQYINVFMRDAGDQEIPKATLATYDYISVDVYNGSGFDVVLYYNDQVTPGKTVAAGQWTTLTFSAAEVNQWFYNGHCTFFLQQDGVTLYFDNVNACKVS